MKRAWRTGSADRLDGNTRQVTSVGFRPDGQRLATGSLDQTVKVSSPDP
jgi:WD40 repeat protein